MVLTVRLAFLVLAFIALGLAAYGEWLMDKPTTPRGEEFIYWSKIAVLASFTAFFLVLWITAPVAEGRYG